MKKIILLLTLILASGIYAFGQQQGMSKKEAAANVHEAKIRILKENSTLPVSNAGLYGSSGREFARTDANGMMIISVPASSTDMYTIKAGGFDSREVKFVQASKKSADYSFYLTLSPLQEELVKVYVKQDPETYVKTANPETKELQLDFAVQLSASSKPISDITSLKSWEEIGPLYVHTENGLYKVRIGPFDTQDKAKQVLLQVKERGKKDAFIVIQKGLENYEPIGYVKYEENDASMEATPVATAPPVLSTTPIVTSQAETRETGVEYKVRLASYLKPGGFNTKDIDQYGPLESYRQGEWTIMMIGGFKTADEAKKVRDQVIGKGYSDARVVADREGVLQDVE